MKTIKLTDGSSSEVIHEFDGGTRCLVLYDGLYVFVDQVPDTDTFDISGQPAHGDEIPILNTLVSAMKDSVVETRE